MDRSPKVGQLELYYVDMVMTGYSKGYYKKTARFLLPS
jgi:hypothetical protein